MSCGVLASTTLVPELQHYFYEFVVGSEINKSRVPSPVDIEELLLGTSSFIEMLFNSSYSNTSYEYLYKENTNVLSWPANVRTRIQVYSGSAKYLQLDSEGTNVFDLQQDDLTLLDALLGYRTDGTAVTIVDSTATAVYDSTSMILYASFNNLTTEFSKLIYLFLDLKLYGNFQNYNNLILISTGGVLESCYEAFLIDQYFRFMTAREPNLIYDPEAPEAGSC